MTQTCPLCRSDQSQPFESLKAEGRTIEYRLCSRCGMVFQGEDWKKADLDQFYANDYRKLVEGEDQVSDKNRAIEETRARLLVSWLKAQGVQTVRRHMDIGASTGALINRSRREFGAQVLGVELSNSHRAFAETRGLRMLPSLDVLETQSEQRFDLISLIHVLEHLPEPVQTLSHLRERWLTSDGAFLLEVPNLYAHNSYEIAHLHAFSRHTLLETLRLAGYRVDALHVHGQPRSNVLGLYITVLARPATAPANQTVQPEGSVRLKRRLGMTKRRLLERLMPGQAWLPFPTLPNNEEK
ncbi:protein containg methyltransferase domain [Longilinea arvoryzae]|uniref:Protein containg methyltransferase domain n=1 Tax=Longilinea arvoryzae TaxID=360412 RepID=A0A0S7BGV2_9CHLR|nr:class I SAM-dependent methyltransferase [Longilinea arvoryzae]GAP13779.1 protein containg methyltransferase domain [Longilinea arvoryzae]